MDKTRLADYPALTYKDDQVSIEINCRGAREYTKRSEERRVGKECRL